MNPQSGANRYYDLSTTAGTATEGVWPGPYEGINYPLNGSSSSPFTVPENTYYNWQPNSAGGSTSPSVNTIPPSSTQTGYGFETTSAFGCNIAGGTWTFQNEFDYNIGATGVYSGTVTFSWYPEVAVYAYTGSAVTELFTAVGTTPIYQESSNAVAGGNVGGNTYTNFNVQFSVNEPYFGVAGNYLLVEYWLNINVTGSTGATADTNSGTIYWGMNDSNTYLIIPACGNSPTFTSTPTGTSTYTPSSTPTPTSSNTSTASSTPTYTPTWTNTSSATNTGTSTATNTSTSTPTNTASATGTSTNTASSTSTPTGTNTATSSATNTATNTGTNTSTVTFTQTNTSTNTASNTATNTATVTSTNTVTNTSTNTSTRTATASATNTPTNTFTLVDTATNTNTPTSSGTATNTGTSTCTNTSTRTNTTTSTATNTGTSTSTQTSTPTQTSTMTASETVTSTSTSTVSSSPTNTQTNTTTPTATTTWSATDSPTPTATSTATTLGTPTATFTMTQDLSGIGKTVLGPVPAPSGGTIALFPDKPILSCQVDLYDWLGESITHWSASGPYQPSWNIGALAPGIYIARIKLILLDGSQETTLQKIVVAR